MAIVSIKWAGLKDPNKQPSFQDATGAAPVVPTPTFTSATNTSYTAAITGYDAQFTYTVSASVGSAVRTDGNVTVSGLSANQSSTLTVTAANIARELSFSSAVAFLSLPVTPTLSRSGGTTTTVTVAIGNYDAGLTYTVGASVGSATRSGNTITVTGLTEGQATTVTATASNSSGSSAQGSLATGAVPATPTISFATATTSSLTFTITNYNAAYSYSVSASAGSASRSGNTITVSGLGEGVTVTANATATANSINSAQGGASGTTLQLPTGGTVTTSGGYRIHTFTTTGTFTTYSPVSVEYLVVAGGGGSPPGATGGGAGAGGFLSGTALNISTGSHAITVGGGGSSSMGSSSSIGSLISTTGGGSNGGPGFPWTAPTPFASKPGALLLGGGSGAGWGAQNPPLPGGNSVSGQGNPGGAGGFGSLPVGFAGGGGGGGGAGGGGGNAFSEPWLNRWRGGAGGPGKPSTISGANLLYAGGGGGSAPSAVSPYGPYGVPGAGGPGGGGGTPSPNGTANTGGGGFGNSGAGGSGIVIIRYPV